MSNPYPIVFIVGPTASGKSDLAFKLAKNFSGSIVNMDSLQVFTDLNIGTAKPIISERQQLPHFLFDIRDLGQTMTAGEYKREAEIVIESQGGQSPLFFVGGSGFYMQALEKGMFEVRTVPDEIKVEYQDKLIQNGLESLYQELLDLDSIYAQKISPSDSYRIFRALTVIRATGESLTEIQKKHEQDIEHKGLRQKKLKIGIEIPRDLLRQRVRERTQFMLHNGLIEEVESLLKRAPRDWSPLKSVGYKEIVSYLEGYCSLDEAEINIVNNTMKLAKKQMTWFKRDKDIRWYSYENPFEEVSHFLTTQFKQVETPPIKKSHGAKKGDKHRVKS
jgi:tRNA dimethylallyltransferase